MYMFASKLNPPKMMMKNLTLPRLICLSLFSLLLTSCTKDEIATDAKVLEVSNATITFNDLIGSWELSQMISDTAVNLNNDAVSNTNLLSETSCFNNMSITFNSDGTFTSNNATMTFESGTSTDKFACISDRIDTGAWKVDDNNLILSTEIDGYTYTHFKKLSLTINTFAFDVTKIESDQYVDDPGNTQASEIRILELEYTKVE